MCLPSYWDVVVMDEPEKRKRRVCFTGHRPEKLSIPESEIKEKLKIEILKCIQEGFNVFISGMARGVDMWAAEIVLHLRDNGYNIKLICGVPYKGFEDNWNNEWKLRYNKILSNSDLVRYISPYYSQRFFQIRNEWMVNHSAKVIAAYNEKSGGTYNTIKYANNHNIYITIIKL